MIAGDDLLAIARVDIEELADHIHAAHAEPSVVCGRQECIFLRRMINQADTIDQVNDE